ncbi:uncharacterized protein BJ212DRAFT_1295760 [Suillus subaureus]|uniref:Uncharacterized protein n=1 Tax=Suillus subaureus TaxID=48587 RepID=A0A9P7JIL4_9AGAM|nr:uncharacterized protein BJ212DRAFT_1295760 [Suillus subaureus]KAG1824638.1 hypothetical protein BJ212DRAFT_1295760 [Suillus subaureus]
MASTTSSQPQQINVADLDLQQLSDVRRQLEEELNHLTNSFAQLKQAQAKFKSCIENVGEVKPQNKSRAQATKYYETKVEYIRTNLDTLQETIQKQENMNYLINVMQAKLQQSQTQPIKA